MIFQGEVGRQCKFSLTALNDMNEALKSSNFDRFWYSVQGVLIAVGNISKLLWPPSEKIPNRGRDLRDSLQVKGDSALGPRTFRNHFEHFDERLEDWMTSSERHNLADSNIMGKNGIAGLEVSDFLRNYDTDTKAVTFQGDEYPLQPIANAVSELYKATLQVDAKRQMNRRMPPTT